MKQKLKTASKLVVNTSTYICFCIFLKMSILNNFGKMLRAYIVEDLISSLLTEVILWPKMVLHRCTWGHNMQILFSRTSLVLLHYMRVQGLELPSQYPHLLRPRSSEVKRANPFSKKRAWFIRQKWLVEFSLGGEAGQFKVFQYIVYLLQYVLDLMTAWMVDSVQE